MENQTKDEMNSSGSGLPFPMEDADIPVGNTVSEASNSSSASSKEEEHGNKGPQNNSVNNTSNDGKEKGETFKNTVSDYAVSMYQYAANVKQNGQTSIADLMFQDLMKIIMATNTASGAIGREKFIELLAEGYYASSRMIEYMKFLESLGISGKMYEPLMECNERIHRVFGASLKTTRNKKQNVSVGM